jgi:hypothetical protein
MIPHNAGWFVPGVANAYASAGEAIEALFELVYTAPDATVYRPGKRGRGVGIVLTGAVNVTGDIVAASPAPEVTSERTTMTTAPLTSEQHANVERAIKPKTAPVETPQMGLF